MGELAQTHRIELPPLSGLGETLGWPAEGGTAVLVGPPLTPGEAQTSAARRDLAELERLDTRSLVRSMDRAWARETRTRRQTTASLAFSLWADGMAGIRLALVLDGEPAERVHALSSVALMTGLGVSPHEATMIERLVRRLRLRARPVAEFLLHALRQDRLTTSKMVLIEQLIPPAGDCAEARRLVSLLAPHTESEIRQAVRLERERRSGGRPRSRRRRSHRTLFRLQLTPEAHARYLMLAARLRDEYGAPDEGHHPVRLADQQCLRIALSRFLTLLHPLRPARAPRSPDALIRTRCPSCQTHEPLPTSPRDRGRPGGRIPRTTRLRVLMRSDGRCEFPGCGRPAAHLHHIHPRRRDGSGEPANLVALCVFHHQRTVETGAVRVTGRAPDRLVWTTRAGRRIASRPGAWELFRRLREGDVLRTVREEDLAGIEASPARRPAPGGAPQIRSGGGTLGRGGAFLDGLIAALLEVRAAVLEHCRGVWLLDRDDGAPRRHDPAELQYESITSLCQDRYGHSPAEVSERRTIGGGAGLFPRCAEAYRLGRISRRKLLLVARSGLTEHDALLACIAPWVGRGDLHRILTHLAGQSDPEAVELVLPVDRETRSMLSVAFREIRRVLGHCHPRNECFAYLVDAVLDGSWRQPSEGWAGLKAPTLQRRLGPPHFATITHECDRCGLHWQYDSQGFLVVPPADRLREILAVATVVRWLPEAWDLAPEQTRLRRPRTHAETAALRRDGGCGISDCPHRGDPIAGHLRAYDVAMLATRDPSRDQRGTSTDGLVTLCAVHAGRILRGEILVLPPDASGGPVRFLADCCPTLAPGEPFLARTCGPCTVDLHALLAEIARRERPP